MSRKTLHSLCFTTHGLSSVPPFFCFAIRRKRKGDRHWWGLQLENGHVGSSFKYVIMSEEHHQRIHSRLEKHTPSHTHACVCTLPSHSGTEEWKTERSLALFLPLLCIMFLHGGLEARHRVCPLLLFLPGF